MIHKEIAHTADYQESSVLVKANSLFETGQVSSAFALLSTFASQNDSKAVKAKLQDLKKACLEKYGLPHDHTELKKIEKFMQWFIDQGGYFDGVYIKYYADDYRGVHSNKFVAENSVILRVPNKLLITPELGKVTPIGRKIVEKAVVVNWEYLVFITIFLLTEMHKEFSEWKPYLDVYPKSASTFPIFYSTKEKNLLKGTPMIEHIEAEFLQIQKEYNNILDELSEFKEIPFEEYIRTKVLVTSRVFKSGASEYLMVPFAGLFYILTH